VITRDKDGKIQSIIATGNPALFCFHSVSDQLRPSDKPPLIGEAKIIQYFPKAENVVFLKEAVLQQNSDIIQGEHLTYSLTQQTLVATPEAGKKTTIILAPNSPKTTNT
jgi:lipopolysaccharide transport protein LptA